MASIESATTKARNASFVAAGRDLESMRCDELTYSLHSSNTTQCRQRTQEPPLKEQQQQQQQQQHGAPHLRRHPERRPGRGAAARAGERGRAGGVEPQSPHACDVGRLGQGARRLWLLEHRGQHDLNTADDEGYTALYLATQHGLLEMVQALVAAGANPAARSRKGWTPLMRASAGGYTDIVVFLLQLPAIKASIDHIASSATALSWASRWARLSTVQVLLDAGADPTIPGGEWSPITSALSNDVSPDPHAANAIAALLRHAIDEADRARALHKARSLLGAGAAALACLQGRVEQGQALPLLEIPSPQQQQQQQQLQEEKVWATAAFAVGVSGGLKDTGLCDALYMKLLGYMLPVWADKGPAVDEDDDSEEEDWVSGLSESGLSDDDSAWLASESGGE